MFNREPPCVFDIGFTDVAFGKRELLQLEAKAYSSGDAPKYGAGPDGYDAVGITIHPRQQPLRGTVTLTPRKGNPLLHHGLHLIFLGQIIVRSPHHGKDVCEFASAELQVAELPESTDDGILSVPFAFEQLNPNYESYVGANLIVRFLLRINVKHKIWGALRHHFLLWFEDTVSVAAPPAAAEAATWLLGQTDELRLQLTYARLWLRLPDDVVTGEVHFYRLCNVAVESCAVQLVRRELRLLAGGREEELSVQTMLHFEVMDGHAREGAVVPIRVPLHAAAATLSPTFANIHGRAAVRYYLTFVLTVAGGERRLFKEAEVALIR